jgi:hypothetical protein
VISTSSITEQLTRAEWSARRQGVTKTAACAENSTICAVLGDIGPIRAVFASPGLDKPDHRVVLEYPRLTTRTE